MRTDFDDDNCLVAEMQQTAGTVDSLWHGRQKLHVSFEGVVPEPDNDLQGRVGDQSVVNSPGSFQVLGFGSGDRRG
ncbi:MAG: hypothetical protein AAF802_09125 [Planctomycetota bacterium]